MTKGWMVMTIEEDERIRAEARRMHKPHDPIPPDVHFVYVDECRKIDKEAEKQGAVMLVVGCQTRTLQQ